MTDWKDRQVLIVGAARQGLALVRFLAKNGAKVTITDSRSLEQLADARARLEDLPVEWVLGEHPLSLLDQTQFIGVSGGIPLTIPLIQRAFDLCIPLTNDSQIFLEYAPCRVVGITGSAGKTTTTSLVGRMLQAAVDSNPADQRKVWVGGNIGNPLIENIEEMKPTDIAVMELSSFQLQQMTISPRIAAVLNITPNHLDRHGTMDYYIEAKAAILDYQHEDDIAVLCRDDFHSTSLTDRVVGWLYTFGRSTLSREQLGTFIRDDHIWLKDEKGERKIMPLDMIELRGEHNQLNVMAACTIAAVAGFSPEAMRQGVQGFKGVQHRLELVRELDGVKWYNDSIATAPERSIAALKAFTEPIILLAGGKDKNLPWQEFAEKVRQKVDHLILFGEAGPMIQDVMGEVSPGNRPYSVQVFADLQDAVQAARQAAVPGSVVLLSPGGTSYDAYFDFEERGNLFRDWVMAL